MYIETLTLFKSVLVLGTLVSKPYTLANNLKLCSLQKCLPDTRGYNRAVRRGHCVGGGAPVNFGRRRRAAGPKKSAEARLLANIFFQRFPKKITNFVLSSKFSDNFFLVIDRKLHETK